MCSIVGRVSARSRGGATPFRRRHSSVSKQRNSVLLFGCPQVSSCLVNHPLIIKYYSTFRCSGAHVTVMEYVQAVDLLDVVNEFSKTQQLPLKVKQHVVAQLCLAFCHLHFKGAREILERNRFVQ